ncbi:flavodoxin family protein [Desulfonatronospira sp.]|uniref:flavodoxin family protein n=1 Tax=Desulfonatronospira sp. TaxID=1962951 RepID=UPI0025BD0A2E|nr:flavodoxin family protein [Desulfonatronospira sp.]
MNVVGFNGSPRENGNTARLVRTVLDTLEANGITTEYIQLGGQNIHGCIACMQCRENQDKQCSIKNDKCNEYLAKMIQADGIVVGAPTYFADLNAETKALLDRASFVALQNGGLFRGKVGTGVVAARRGGAVRVMDSILKPFQMSEMFMPGSTYWNIGYGLDPDEVSEDAEALKNMRNLGGQMAYLLKALQLARDNNIQVR